MHCFAAHGSYGDVVAGCPRNQIRLVLRSSQLRHDRLLRQNGRRFAAADRPTLAGGAEYLLEASGQFAPFRSFILPEASDFGEGTHCAV